MDTAWEYRFVSEILRGLSLLLEIIYRWMYFKHNKSILDKIKSNCNDPCGKIHLYEIWLMWSIDLIYKPTHLISQFIYMASFDHYKRPYGLLWSVYYRDNMHVKYDLHTYSMWLNVIYLRDSIFYNCLIFLRYELKFERTVILLNIGYPPASPIYDMPEISPWSQLQEYFVKNLTRSIYFGF